MSMPGSSSSSSKTTSSAANDKTLLKFYQRKFEEFHRKEDKYKEKVDRHLKNLITDRHELEEEVLRRGEKISDLQKALVELQLNIFEERSRFLKLSAENEELKRNEEHLHRNIRQLLAMTQQQDLKDRIIYILESPKVEIGYQSEFPTKSESKEVLLANKKLKDELDELKLELDQVLGVSKKRENSVLEDCKQTLEKSKIRILQDNIQNKELQKKLQNLQAQEKRSLSATEAKEKHSFSTLNEDIINLKHSLSENKKPRVNIKHSSSEIKEQLENAKYSLSDSKSQDEYRKHSLSDKGQQQNVKNFLSDFIEQTQYKKHSSSDSTEHDDDKKYSLSPTRSISSESNLANLVVSESLASVCSQMRSMHLSLGVLQKDISKVDNILNTIHATKLYQRLAKIPKAPAFMEIHVEQNTISQLESTLRRCTLLTYDINDKNQTLCKNISSKRTLQNNADLSSELKHLDRILTEMTGITADNDLQNLELKRSVFFHALRDSSVAISEEDRLRCLNCFKKIVANNTALKKIASSAADFTQSIVKKYSARKPNSLLDAFSSHNLEKNVAKERVIKSDSALLSKKEAKSQSIKDLTSLGKIYKSTIEEAKNLGFDQSPEGKSMSEKLQATEQQLHEEKLKKCDDNFDDYIMKTDYPEIRVSTSNSDEILREIDKTLIKVMEGGKFTKDEKLCKKLAEKVDEITTKFKELMEEFSIKTFQDQFSEYSRVTLSKLEDLANQCKNSVEAAEAQIAAHKSNAKQLSGKLRETEDLLRESINECLSLKKTVKFAEEQHEMEKYSLVSQLREKLENISERAEIQSILEDIVSYIDVRKDTAADPFVCVFCKDGMGHATCKEKIQELTAEERKSRTELKILMREAKEEKENLRYHREIAEHNVSQLNKSNEELKQNIRTLESKNNSLLEQLKVLRNRLKRMEQFRLLEVEGFQTDIKNLKARIQEMEKNLRKAVVIFESNSQDMQLLNVVHDTAHHSKQAAMDVRRLKAKLYELENCLKGL